MATNHQYPPPDTPNITTNATFHSCIEEENGSTVLETPKEEKCAASPTPSEANGVSVSPATSLLKFQRFSPSMTTNATSPSNIRENSTAIVPKSAVPELGAP